MEPDAGTKERGVAAKMDLRVHRRQDAARFGPVFAV